MVSNYHAVVVIEVVGTLCDCGGSIQVPNTLIAHNHLANTWKLKPSLVYVLSLCDPILLVNCSLGNLILLVIMQPTLPTQSTLNVNLESASITIL